MNYRLAYAMGFHPWEDAAADPPFVAKFDELLTQEEGNGPPYGAALDLGTGSGVWGVALAQRGWQVTGVDIVDKALRRAHGRVRDAGVDMKVVHGDVTDLRGAGVGSGYRLVLDTGTFHGLTAPQRAAMGREVDAVAATDATVLLLIWPRSRRPLIRGVDRDGVEAVFPGWTITAIEPSHFRLPKPLELIMRPDEHWYRLRRLPRSASSA
jgi:SAM-dependent methyltransferase